MRKTYFCTTFINSTVSKINIAIDGYSSCGKSTLAKALAKELGLVYVDSGAMYRAVTLFALEEGFLDEAGDLDKEGLLTALDRVEIAFHDHEEPGKARTYLNGRDVEDTIRTMRVSEHVSTIAPIPEVRQKLVKIQHRLSRKGGVVMDGRDIGTVVIPDAELKLFMTADSAERANRRFKELQEKGQDVDLDAIRRNIEKRDHEDTHRELDPLRQAEDAIVIDNTDLTPQEQFDLALWYAREKGG